MTRADPEADDHAPPFGGVLTPLMTVIGGVGAYFLVFRVFVDPVHDQVAPIDPESYRFLWEAGAARDPTAVLAADLAARYAVAIPSAMLAMAALASFVAAFAIILRRFDWPTRALGAVAGLAGALLGYVEQYNNPVRGAVADCPPGDLDRLCPLDQAVLRAGPEASFSGAGLEQLQLLVHMNSALSVAACCVLGVCFLAIARQADAGGLDPVTLRRRRTALSFTLCLAALILVLSIATTHGYYHFASSLIADAPGRNIGALGSAGASYWGAVYSTVFVIIALPAVFGMYRDVRRAAIRANPGASHAARTRWCAEHGLTVDLREVLLPMLTALAPVLTSPLLDALRPALLGG